MPFDSNLYGFFIKKGDAQAIFINTNNSLGRQYFTAAHEYYHLKYGMNLDVQNQEIEKEADTFASYLLIPREALNYHLKKRLTQKNKDGVDISDCLYLENYFKISHSALVLRLNLDKHITKSKYEELLDYNISSEALKHGYSLELYQPTKLDRDRIIYSDYAELAEIALKKMKISEGKYNEYLLEGGYLDILFGDEQGV